MALATAPVATWNVAEVWPAATTTETGTVALLELVDRLTVAPPGPAAPERFTVPVDALPPMTELGFNVRETRTAGVTVRVAF